MVGYLFKKIENRIKDIIFGETVKIVNSLNLLRQINIQVGFNNEENIIHNKENNIFGSRNEFLKFGKIIINDKKIKKQIIKSIICTKQEIIILSFKFDPLNIVLAVRFIFEV